ncbi:MAG: hypothetical protein ACMVO3_13520 [Thalassobaculum sp.]
MSKPTSTVSGALSGLVDLEPGFLRRAVDRCQIGGMKLSSRIVTLDILHQGRDVLLHPEQHAAGVVEADIDVPEPAGAAPMIGRQDTSPFAVRRRI